MKITVGRVRSENFQSIRTEFELEVLDGWTIAETVLLGHLMCRASLGMDLSRGEARDLEELYSEYSQEDYQELLTVGKNEELL